jgi:leucine dehydrogenase
MEQNLFDRMAQEGFERVVALQDRRSGLRGFIVLHDTVAGPAFGGVRRRAYRDEAEALADCMRLARSMTWKCAMLDLPAGGAKTCLMDSAAVEWESAYEALGRAVEELGGKYYTGPDIGTSERELEWLSRTTTRVTRPGPDGPMELSEATAEGVFQGMVEALRSLDGEEDWPARRVVLQGLGEVGSRVARRLSEAGAKVIASEVREERALEVARELELELVNPRAEFDEPCDIFAPCALGGILHDITLARLRCRVIAGAANNVLARLDSGDDLHERGILYVPDILVSSGALLRGAVFHLEGTRLPVDVIGKRIGAAVREVLRVANEVGDAPIRVAMREAERRVRARWED